MSLTFYVVYQMLEWLAAVTGFTYKEINVIVFYVLVPLVYFALIDKILGKPYCTGSYLVILITVGLFVRDLAAFAESVFDGSVSFLLFFSRFGVGYDLASVLICVVFPLLLLVLLIYLAFPAWFRKRLPTVARIMEGPERVGR